MPKRLIVLTTTETACFEEPLFSRVFVVTFAKPHADRVTEHVRRIGESLGFDPDGCGNWPIRDFGKLTLPGRWEYIGGRLHAPYELDRAHNKIGCVQDDPICCV